MIAVTLYTARGCHLCEEAKTVLLRVRKDLPFALDEVCLDDAGGDPGHFRESVPVVTVGGTVAFTCRVDESRFRRMLTRAPGGSAP
jgi:hypothetical protein